MISTPTPFPSVAIPPPFPAPYLDGCPSLPDKMLARLDGRATLPRDEERFAENTIRSLARDIRRRRSSYEAERGVVIESEPPRVPPPVASACGGCFDDED